MNRCGMRFGDLQVNQHKKKLDQIGYNISINYLKKINKNAGRPSRIY